jgi:hypothetical protein
MHDPQAGQDLMQRFEHARLLARLESMPMIEQAKGIIMAQSHCGNAEAFDLLRRASQRRNVTVRDLAAQIVAKTAQVPPSACSRSHAVARSHQTLKLQPTRTPTASIRGIRPRPGT